MRVLIISHMFPNEQNPIGGMFVAEQVRALAKYCDLTVISPIPWAPPLRRISSYYHSYSTVPRESRFESISVYHPRFFILPKLYSLAAWTFPMAIRGLVRKLHRESPLDLIHAHTLFPDGYGASIVAKELGIPLVITTHGGDAYTRPAQSRIQNRACRKAIINSDRVISVSKWLSGFVKKLGALDEQLEVIPNVVDRTIFSMQDSTECRKTLSLPIDNRIVLYVGNLVPIKGLDYLIRAFSAVTLKAPDAKLYLVGKGTQREALIQLRDELGLADSVHLVGSKPHDQLPYWFNAADLFVLPSIKEGLGTVLLEAMSCGRPSVASDAGGIPEILTDQSAGLLVKPQDVQALTDGILAGIERPWDYQAISRQADQYSMDSIARRLESLYTRVTTGS